MANIFVSNESIRETIEYFKNFDIISPEQVGLFFLFKAAKLNSRDYTTFPRIGNMTADEKKRNNRALYDLCGIFDAETEKAEKYTSLFPFSISATVKSSSFYNGGTKFSGVLSRVNDTIDNTLVDASKYLRRDELTTDRYKFPPNYLEMLKNDFLKGVSISLPRFAAWYYRFYTFEVSEEWITNQTHENYERFTAVCKKKLIEDLHISADELAELFADEDVVIKYKDVKTTGEELRAMISFDTDVNPDVTTSPTPVEYMQARGELSMEEVNQLMTPRGRNVTKEQLLELLLATKQVVLSGPPGTGKSFISNEVRTEFSDTLLIQFHPNLTYEQFIGGNTFDDNGQVTPKAGMFLEYCETARQNPDSKYLFLIDEINRGNISKIFGEIILTLDREYTATLPTALKLSNGSIIREFSIPSNLYILATMNSADRSIALVDYAIRRRFAFIPFYPNSEIVDFLSDYGDLHTLTVGKLMTRINEKLYSVLGDEDLLLGQSYFMPKWIKNDGRYKWTDETLKSLFNYYVLPIIQEYTYGNRRYLLNIVGEKLSERITDTAEFVEEITNQFGV